MCEPDKRYNFILCQRLLDLRIISLHTYKLPFVKGKKSTFIMGCHGGTRHGSADLRLKEGLGLLTTKGAVRGTGERPRRVRQPR